MLLAAGLSGVCRLVGTDAGEGQEPCCSSGLLVLTPLLSLAAVSWGSYAQGGSGSLSAKWTR